MRYMRKSVCEKDDKSSEKLPWLPEFDRLLIAGIKRGPAMKKEAINKILQLAPHWTRGDCWRRIKELRRAAKRAALEERHPAKTKKSREAPAAPRPVSRPWTPADDDRLLNLAGYEPVKRIAQRLDRSVRAVRFRMAALGMSARVTDAWSLRALWKMLRVRPSRLRYFIGNGLLKVRDARITANSLATLCDENQPSVAPATLERVTSALVKGAEGYTWERAADLLGVTVAQVQSGISAGQLRVVDTFVTDRSFEEFCKKHGDRINMTLIDPATAKWLVSEYGVSQSATNGTTVSRVQKHALVVRACHCGRKIAGNAYFRHSRTCQSVAAASTQSPNRASRAQLSESMER
jgi:hypothetical protein